MTHAPSNISAVRRLLLDHLDIRENSNAYPTDLDPNEVGIVGDPAHRGGYHCGRDRVDSDDYSVRQSPRDRGGLTNAASAIDTGWFEIRVRGKDHNLRTYSIWLVAQCKANTPDSRHIREVIYSPDGNAVKRWDRLGKSTTGDSSHRWHTHESHFRDTERTDKTPLYRRYLSTIGLLEDDVTVDELLDTKIRLATLGAEVPVRDLLKQGLEIKSLALPALDAKVDALTAAVTELAARPASGAPTHDELVAALREVLGSVDGVSPAS